MSIFLILMMASVGIFASSWSDLNEGKSYQLSRPLQLSQANERSHSILDISRGEKFVLRRIGPLRSDSSITTFIFSYPGCPGAHMKTKLEQISRDGASSVLAEFASCSLHFYIGKEDLSTNSVFL